MFFKVVYYLIGLLIVLYEVGILLKIKEWSSDMFDFMQWYEDWKEKYGRVPDLDDYPSEVKEYAIPILIVTVVELLWLSMGFFSFNWLLILLYFFYSFGIARVWYKAVKKSRSGYQTYATVGKLILIGTIIFAIINTFHLHIDLVKVIFGG